MLSQGAPVELSCRLWGPPNQKKTRLGPVFIASVKRRLSIGLLLVHVFVFALFVFRLVVSGDTCF